MNQRPGFTLVELLIVFFLLAIFAGFAAVLSAPAIRNAEFDRVRETIRSELVAAQADTIGGTLDASWGVKIFANSLTRYRGASYAARVTAYDRVTAFGNDVIATGTSDIAFTRPSGLPASAAAIVITSGSLRATTTVSLTGAISVQ